MGDQQKRMVKEDVWHLDTRYKRGRIGVKSQLPRGTSWIYVFFSWNKHLFVLKTHCLTSNVWPLILSVLSESDSEITGRIRKVVSNFKGCPTNCILFPFCLRSWEPKVEEVGVYRWWCPLPVCWVVLPRCDPSHMCARKCDKGDPLQGTSLLVAHLFKW